MIITELLTGATVSSLLEKSKQPMWRRLQMARYGLDTLHCVCNYSCACIHVANLLHSETCLGMAWLHQKQVVHQDLKLENLLLDASGAVKISDFVR